MSTSWVNGKTIVITGGTSGIGKAAAFAVASAGGRVVLAGRTQARVDEAAAQVAAAGGEATGIAADVGDPAAVGRLMDAARDRFGSLDGLVTSAGLGKMGPLLTQPLNDIEETIRTDLLGTIYCVREAATRMQPGSQIITVSSAMAASPGSTRWPKDPLTASSSMAVYAAVKSAVTLLSDSLRTELGSLGIRLSCLMPGSVATHFQDDWGSPEDWAVSPQPGQTGSLDVSNVMRARDIAPSILFAFDLPERSLGTNLEIV